MRSHRPLIFSAVVVSASFVGCSESSSNQPQAVVPSEDGGCTPEGGVDPPIDPPAVHTPRWAFEPWISKDISNGPDTYDFVKGFKDRDIPVGVVVIDSPWETHYNTFVPNEKRYPEFGKMVADLHAQDVRIVLWMTPMINDWYLDSEPGGDYFPGPAPNLAEAQACGFLVDDGRLYTWWKGRGGGVDFFNPAAITWWHRQQDALFAMGINGWKLDFADSYIRNAEVQTAQGKVPHQAYSEAYYRDFYAYGASKRGTSEFVTMVRPYDKSYDFEGRFFARPEHAPVTWVGDQRRDWIGLSDALDHIFRSAAANYVVIGSDVGGYLDFDDVNPGGGKIAFDLNVFQRWVAVGAMSPFMQLHGRANLTPWAVPGCDDACNNAAVVQYRYWATLHHELVPFFYSLGQQAHANGTAMIHPQGNEADWPGDYRWVLGDAFLVAPVLDATGTRDVAFPDGSRWLDWWDLAATPIEGGTILQGVEVSDPSRIPLYVREGSIVPMNVGNDVTGMGTSASAGRLTLLVVPPAQGTSSFALQDEDDAVTQLDVRATATGSVVTMSRALRPSVLRVRVNEAPGGVTANAVALAVQATQAALDAAETGWWWDAASRSAWVRVAANAGKSEVVLQSP